MFLCTSISSFHHHHYSPRAVKKMNRQEIKNLLADYMRDFELSGCGVGARIDKLERRISNLEKNDRIKEMKEEIEEIEEIEEMKKRECNECKAAQNSYAGKYLRMRDSIGEIDNLDALDKKQDEPGKLRREKRNKGKKCKCCGGTTQVHVHRDIYLDDVVGSRWTH